MHVYLDAYRDAAPVSLSLTILALIRAAGWDCNRVVPWRPGEPRCDGSVHSDFGLGRGRSAHQLLRSGAVSQRITRVRLTRFGCPSLSCASEVCRPSGQVSLQPPGGASRPGCRPRSQVVDQLAGRPAKRPSAIQPFSRDERLRGSEAVGTGLWGARGAGRGRTKKSSFKTEGPESEFPLERHQTSPLHDRCQSPCRPNQITLNCLADNVVMVETSAKTRRAHLFLACASLSSG